MTYIEQLLNGENVEWKKLGEVCLVQRGASPRPIKKYLTDDLDAIPWIKIGDTKPGEKYILSSKEFITKEGADKSRILQKGDFIMSNSMSYGRPYILGIKGAVHDGWAIMTNINKKILPDFLYYYLSTNHVQHYWDIKINGSTMKNLNSDIIKSLPIPLPPLSVQHKIVEILDKFTELEAELEAELDCRKRQYEYYRNQLLSFDMLNRGGAKVKWCKGNGVGRCCRNKKRS